MMGVRPRVRRGRVLVGTAEHDLPIGTPSFASLALFVALGA
jgi:hypothetical protein